MSKPTPRPFVPFLFALTLFVLLLGPAPATAVPWPDGGQAAGFFIRFWGAVSAIWSEEGCVIDGNGKCREGQALASEPGRTSVRVEAGCIIDGNGGCHEGRSDLGDDPNGGSVPSIIGCVFDPNGSCQP